MASFKERCSECTTYHAKILRTFGGYIYGCEVFSQGLTTSNSYRLMSVSLIYPSTFFLHILDHSHPISFSHSYVCPRLVLHLHISFFLSFFLSFLLFFLYSFTLNSLSFLFCSNHQLFHNVHFVLIFSFNSLLFCISLPFSFLTSPIDRFYLLIISSLQIF